MAADGFEMAADGFEMAGRIETGAKRAGGLGCSAGWQAGHGLSALARAVAEEERVSYCLAGGADEFAEEGRAGKGGAGGDRVEDGEGRGAAAGEAAEGHQLDVALCRLAAALIQRLCSDAAGSCNSGGDGGGGGGGGGPVGRGAILCFLPGWSGLRVRLRTSPASPHISRDSLRWAELRRVSSLLAGAAGGGGEGGGGRLTPPPMRVHLLHSSVPLASQRAALEQSTAGGPRKVVLATSIAETSITIPGEEITGDLGRFGGGVRRRRSPPQTPRS